MTRRLRAHAFLVLGVGIVVVCFCSSAHAQQQPLCIPGTTLCINGNGQGGLGGGAHGQVGPNGASGGANGNGNGNANGGGRVQPPPQYPPPQYPPPQPPPQQPQQPAAPTPITPPTPAPTPAPAYVGERGPRVGAMGIGLYPAMRVGKDSGFHFGGAIAIGLHEPRWGFELDTLFLRGGTVRMTDISFVPTFFLRFGSDDDGTNVYNGFYACIGPEFRFSFADTTPAEAASAGQIFHIGAQIGAGYEMNLVPNISLRILDVRLFGAWRTDSIPPPDDRFGHESEYGVLFMTGITFDG
jgi:hypothetical protein